MSRARSALLAAAIAALLYLPAAHWGAPHATAPDRVKSWGVDDETPLGPLAEVHNLIAPKPDRNLGYPLLYSLLVAAAYAPYMAWLWATGELRAVSAGYPFGLADPATALAHLTWIAHALTALLGAAFVGACADIGRSLGGPRKGWLTAAFAGLAYPVFYYARTGNVDMPVLAFTTLGLAVFARMAAEGVTTRRAAALGAFVGLAAATKEQAAASFLGVPFALALWHQRALGGGLAVWRRAAAWRAPAACILATVVCFGIGSGLFLDPERFFAHLAFGRERLAAIEAGEVAFVTLYPRTAAGQAAYFAALGRALLATFTAPGLLLACAGFAHALLRRERVLWMALPAATFLGVLMLGARSLQLRYLLPLVPSLAVFAAHAVDRAWEARSRPVLRAAAAGLAALALGLSALRGADLTHAMWNDSRYAAGEWLAARLDPGDRIAYFGLSEKLPPLPADVATLPATPFLGGAVEPDVGSGAVRRIEAWLASERPEFVVLVPDYTSRPGAPFSRSCPAQVFEDLRAGRLGYALGARFETPPLVAFARRPPLDYPTVNPPVHVFVRRDRAARGG